MKTTDSLSNHALSPSGGGAGYLFSEFHSVQSKCSVNITLTQFLDKLTSDTFRPVIERLRFLRSQAGQEAEMARLKEQLPCITPSACCQGGHKAVHVKQLSGLLCIDLDHTDGRTTEVKQTAFRLPWVVLAFVSPSGCGVKLFVSIRTEDAKRYGWERLYAAVGRAVSQHVGHAYDSQCKDLTHCCFYSWDPEPCYRPEAEPFVPDEEEMHRSPDPLQPADPEEGGRMDEWRRLVRFLRQFNRQHPFVRGMRNEVCLTLGRSLRCNYFSQKEVDEAILLYARRFAEPDFTEKDVRSRVLAGYQYIIEDEKCAVPRGRVHEGSGFTPNPSETKTDADDRTNVLNKNDELRATAPCIPDEVYDGLPLLLQCATRPGNNRRDRDILLLGSLAACSALFPNVRFYYKDKLYAPNFYLAIVAAAGSGKGMLAFTHSLLDRTDDYYARQRAEQKRKQAAAVRLWEQEQQKARQEKRNPDVSLQPEEQSLQYFKIPVTTSKSFLIDSLAHAGQTGCVMASTEIITLISALRQDYGSYDDILLKTFQHEEVSSAYKTDGLHIARYPRLTLSLSGTHEQFAGLYKSLESGLYSRFAFYTRPQEVNFLNCSPEAQNGDLAALFDTLGNDLLQMHCTLLQSPTLVCFTASQWAFHAAHFDTLLKRTATEGRESGVGIVLRHGLLCMRLAALLTLFRKWEDYRYAKEYNCCDTDFHAAFTIATTLLEHSLLLSTSLPDSRVAPTPMYNYHRLEEVTKLLPARFTYTEFLTSSVGLGMSESTAKRLLKNALKYKLIEKQDDRYIIPADAPLGKGLGVNPEPK